MMPENLGGRPPQLRLEEFFCGRCRAWGVFQDRFGKARRQFDVDIDATWDGRTLTLVESFIYDDGETEERIWRIRKTGTNGYEGHTDDMVGSTNGIVRSNTLSWRYKFVLRVGGRAVTVGFQDQYFQLSDEVLISRADVSKLGLRIGTLTMVFQRLPLAQLGERPVPRAMIA